MEEIVQATNAGGVVLNNHGQIVVVNQNHASWSLPKGHVEDGEDILDAAKREVYEETGLTKLTYVKKLGSYTRSTPSINTTTNQQEIKTMHIFLFMTDEETLQPVDPDNPEAKWVTRAEVEAYLSNADDKRFFTSIVTQLPAVV